MEVQGRGFRVHGEGVLLGFHMGGCQNDGPFLGPYYNAAPVI